MLKKDSPFMVMDYVYESQGTDEFNNVHATLTIDTDRLQLTLYPSVRMEKDSVEKVLRFLQDDRFKKLRVVIMEECDVFIQYEEERLRVVFGEGTRFVEDLIQEEK